MFLEDAKHVGGVGSEGQIEEGVKQTIEQRLPREPVVEHVVNVHCHEGHILEVEDVRRDADSIVIPVTMDQNQATQMSKTTSE